jgi:hypothetical protein
MKDERTGTPARSSSLFGVPDYDAAGGRTKNVQVTWMWATWDGMEAAR